MTFETYMEKKHAKIVQFTENDGLDDDMQHLYEEWITSLEPEEIIKYAEEWGYIMRLEGSISAYKHASEILKEA